MKLLHFCRDSVKGKIEIFHFLHFGKVVMLLLQKQNDCALEIFNHNSHLPHLSAEKNVFENSLNTFEDIAFLLGQCKGKIEIFHFLDVGKVVTLALQNQNICALEIFNHNSHLPHLSAKKNLFWKFFKYFWRYSISAVDSVKEKLKFFIFWMLEKWSRCHCKTKISVNLKFSTTIATSFIFQQKKLFWKFVKYFWRYRISAGTAKKGKIWIFTFSGFWKICNVNTFEDIEFLLGQCKGKIEIFTFSGCWKVVMLLLQNQNICELEIFNHE